MPPRVASIAWPSSKNSAPILLPLDLTDDASIVAAAERIRAEQGRLDVLVNNAGYGSYGAVEDVPLDEARRQFEVNVFGLARLTQLLLPLMRQQRSGKILNVSSIGGKVGSRWVPGITPPSLPSKVFSDCLRMELQPFGIDVVVIEPGAINTEWVQKPSTISCKPPAAPPTPRKPKKNAPLFLMAEGAGSDPGVVASDILKAVTAARPKTRYVMGAFAKPSVFFAQFFPDRFNDWLFNHRHQKRPEAQPEKNPPRSLPERSNAKPNPG